MKRIGSLLTALFLLVALCACEAQELVDMKTKENEEYLAIVWEERIYVPFAVVSKGDCGRQIGYLNGDRNNRVCEWKGHRAEEWLVNYLTMDGGAMLFKEQSVTNLPQGLESEYPWNNKKPARVFALAEIFL